MGSPDTVRFLFGIHNHQPSGNFPEVFAMAVERSYDPLLAAFERHPAVKVAVHYSGCLLEWLEENRPAHLERLRRLVRRGQVEMLSGGFYEPILPIVPPGDREGQIRLLSRWIEERLGARARGMWLAERVWEPGLATDIRRAGMEFTLLDDHHFLGSLDEDPVGGYYTTEDGGEGIALFPISEALRYLIPFHEPEETIAFLAARRGRGEVVVMVDDGEKFGLWPDTYDWVHGRGWLDRFLAALERAQSEGWLVTTTFGETLQALPPRGRVYLPPSSYFEMTQWALPPEKRRRFEHLVPHLRDRGEWDELKPFLRGGFFRSYLARYSEVRHAVARGRALSARLEGMDGAEARAGRPSAARRHLWRAQTNCGYWHGLFGGVYLPHIRRTIHEGLARTIGALRAAQDGGGVRVSLPRTDSPGRPAGDIEAEIESTRVAASVDLAAGGAIHSIDFTRRGVPLGLVMTRRREAYQDEAIEASRRAAASARAALERISIHERMPEAPPDLTHHLVEDARERAVVVERFLPALATPAGLLAASVPDLASPVERCSAAGSGGPDIGELRLSRRIAIGDPGGFEASLETAIRVSEGREGLQIAWRLSEVSGTPPAGSRFAAEWNLALVQDGLRFEAGGESRGPGDAWSAASAGVARVEEPFRGLVLTFRPSPAAPLWHHPVRTVSRCEAGFELIYQGAALIFLWPVTALLDGGVRIDLDLEPVTTGRPGGAVA